MLSLRMQAVPGSALEGVADDMCFLSGKLGAVITLSLDGRDLQSTPTTTPSTVMTQYLKQKPPESQSDLYQSTEMLLGSVRKLLAREPIRNLDEVILFAEKALANSK